MHIDRKAIRDYEAQGFNDSRPRPDCRRGRVRNSVQSKKEELRMKKSSDRQKRYIEKNRLDVLALPKDVADKVRQFARKKDLKIKAAMREIVEFYFSKK